MIQIKNYIEEIIGLDFDLQPVDKSILNQLPIYLFLQKYASNTQKEHRDFLFTTRD